MLKNIFSRLRGNESGATTFEFMIVMPLIVFWFAGSYTFFQAYSEWTRSVKATYTVADILSRQLVVNDNYIEDMNRLYASMMAQDTNDVWLRVTSIEMTEDGHNIDWTEATGLHAGIASNEDIPTELIPALQAGETVILVESFTPFTPFQSYIGLQANSMTRSVVVSPRFNSKVSNSDK